MEEENKIIEEEIFEEEPTEEELMALEEEIHNHLQEIQDEEYARLHDPDYYRYTQVDPEDRWFSQHNEVSYRW